MTLGDGRPDAMPFTRAVISRCQTVAATSRISNRPRRAQRRRQFERARVERPLLDARDLAPLPDERRLELAPARSREHAFPAEGHAAQPLLLALQQAMQQREDREDVAPAGEDAELAVERRTALSGEVADPRLECLRLGHGPHDGGEAEIEGHRES